MKRVKGKPEALFTIPSSRTIFVYPGAALKSRSCTESYGLFRG